MEAMVTVATKDTVITVTDMAATRAMDMEGMVMAATKVTPMVMVRVVISVLVGFADL